MRKTIIFILFIGVFMLNSLCCTAEYTNGFNEYEVINLKCYGDLTVKIRAETDLVDNEYKFINCKNTELELWSCKCNEKNTTIILQTSSDITNVYDIVIQYYIDEIQNDDSKRLKTFSNVYVYAVDYKPPKTVYELPEFNQKYLVGGIIIFIFSILSIGVLFIYKLLFRDKEKPVKKQNIYKHIKNIKNNKEE